MGYKKDENVKTEILEHALKLFQQFGLKKTTMDEIAESCGKAKSTLYHYFKSKEEVFEDVIELELKQLRIKVKECVDKASSLQDKLTTYILVFNKEMQNRLNVYRLVHHDIKDGKIIQEQFNKMMTFEKSYITRILEDGYDIGEYKDINKEDIPVFAELMLAAFLGIIRYSIETDNGYDQDKLEIATKVLIPQIYK